MEHISFTSRHNIVDDFVMVENAELDYGAQRLDAISRAVEGLSSDLRAISLDIHDHPELQYKEIHAHRVLTEYFEKQEGWKVTPSAYDIRTAFVGVYDSGKNGPAVSFNAEYGAFPCCFQLTHWV